MKLPDHVHTVDEVLEELKEDGMHSGDIMHADDYLRIKQIKAFKERQTSSSPVSYSAPTDNIRMSNLVNSRHLYIIQWSSSYCLS